MFERFGPRLEELSGGRIVVDKTFSSGELAPPDDLVPALQTGLLDVAHVWGDLVAEEVPALRQSHFAAQVRQGRPEVLWTLYRDPPRGFGLEQIYREEFREKANLHLVGSIYVDACTLCLKEPIEKLEDLKGRPLWTSYDLAMALEPSGMVYTPLAVEDIYTSLASGIIEGVEYGGISCAYDMRWYEVTDYIVLPELVAGNVQFFLMEGDKWDALPDDLKAICEAAVMDTGQFIKANYSYNEADCLKIMTEEYGFNVIWLSEEEQKKFSQWHFAALQQGVGKVPGGARVVATIEEWLKLYGGM